MAVEVRRAVGDEELRTVAEIDETAFSAVLDDAWYERTMPLRRTGTKYLASIVGEDVGCCGSFPFELTVPGGAPVPVAGVTDVGVLPSHRRRGVLSAMMDRLLDDAGSAGQVAAVLFASESRIYGRYGFGPATRTRRFRLHTARAALRRDAPRSAGRVRMVAADARRAVLPDAFDTCRRRRPGEVHRSPETWDALLGVPRDASRDHRLCMVHEAPDGSCDGYVLYAVAHDWDPMGPHHVAHVHELVAASDAVELSLWEALSDVDLVETVEGYARRDLVLIDSLEDRWALETTGEHDGLWVRLLDVPAALSARRYSRAGELVVEVTDDRRPDVGGCFAVAVGDDGSAEVSRTTAAPDVGLGIVELGSVWMGGTSVQRLAAAGRVKEHTPGALRWGDQAFAWSPAPGITHEF